MPSLLGCGLLLRSVLLITAIIVIRLDVLRPGWWRSWSTPDLDEAVEGGLQQSFLETVRQAAEAVEYLYLAQKGRAYIAPVVEKRRQLRELGSCNRRRPLFHNAGWVYDGRIHLYSAYLDERPNSLYPDSASIQVLASAFGGTLSSSVSLRCIVVVSRRKTFSVRAHVRMIWQRAWDPRESFYNAFLITCGIPLKWQTALKTTEAGELFVGLMDGLSCYDGDDGEIPVLRVNAPSPPVNLYAGPAAESAQNEQLRIAVCVKGLDFLRPVPTQVLAEWIELQFVLGASSITFYKYHLPEQMERLLRHYMGRSSLEGEGKIDLIDMELPGWRSRSMYIGRNRQQKRRHELIAYNDCFYRHIHTVDFVLIIDIDEVVVPLMHSSWQEMLASLLSPKLLRRASAISARNVFKLSSSPETATSLFHGRRRSAVVQERENYGKSFISTRNIASVFNHFALHRLHANVSRTIYLGGDTALKLHFKSSCPMEISTDDCEKLRKNTVSDDSLGRFKKVVHNRVKRVLAEIDLHTD